MIPLHAYTNRSLIQPLEEFTPFRSSPLTSSMAGKITQIIMQDKPR